MTMQISMFLLLICSAITTLIVEAIKKMNGGLKSANIVAAIVGIIVGALIPVGYILYNGIGFNIQNVLTIIAVAVLSWLCSMLGFDKVVQTLKQMNKSDSE